MQYGAPAGTVIFRQTADQTYESKPWDRFDNRSYVIPPVWSAFQPRLGAFHRQSHGVPFLHERRSPGGNRRLVVLDLSVSWFKEATEISIDKAVVRPATWSANPFWTPVKQGATDMAVTDDHAARQSVLSVGFGQSLEILPGRADPDDDSHFTIDFRVGDQAGVIDGKLCDDDTVTLEVRDAGPRRHPSLPARFPNGDPATAAH